MDFKEGIGRTFLELANHFAAKHIRSWHDDKIALPSILSGPASRFIVSHVKDIEPLLAAQYLYSAYHGARSESEKLSISHLWVQAVLAVDAPGDGLLLVNQVFADRLSDHSSGLLNATSFLISQLCPKLPDTLERSQQAEAFLRIAALKVSENDSLGIIDQWEKRIRTIRKFDPEDADQRAARAYYQAPGGSLLSRVADQNTTLDMISEFSNVGWAEGFVPKRQRTRGIVDLGNS